MSDHKTELALRLFPLYFNRADPSRRRAIPTPGDHRLDRRFVPLKHRFDSAIGGIPHPPSNPAEPRLIYSVGSERDALDPPRNPDMCPDLPLA